ncbi:hypothetical protein DYQ86_15970 [Acidobacteria bacterium AB60]|nr:hypothetical protein DYQ86_15970 [Acidobacteria bacterium AB60]
MRRALSALLFCLASVAFGQSTTPNLQLQLPPYATQNWNIPVNQNFSAVDQAIGNLQVPYQGTWSSTAVYSRGQQVTYSGSIYNSLVNSNFNNIPSSSPSAWQLLPAGTGSGGGYTGCASLNNTGIQCSGALQAAQAQLGGTITGHKFTLTNLGTIGADWTMDVTSPTTALNSFLPGVSSDGSNGIVVAGNFNAGTITLSSDQPTGHQAASANASVATLLVTAFGAKGDWANYVKNASGGTSFFTISMTASSTTASVANGLSFVSTDVGKWISIQNPTATPFATVNYVAGTANYTNNNVAQIVSVTDSSHVVLSKAAANSFTGLVSYGTDNAPAFNACAAKIMLTSGAAGGGICEVPPGQYGMFTSSYYLPTGAADDGSYGTPAGGSGASVSCSVSGGALSSCTVSGGSGYTPNSTLQTSISGGCSLLAICGQAFVTVSTNSSGVPQSPATIVYPGFGYTFAPTVSVRALGGDGASVTANMSGGAISTFTINSGGGGYGGGVDWYAMQGTSGCAVISGSTTGRTPYVAKGTATVTSGAVTAMNIATNASGCTSAPAIVFGDNACNSGTAASPVWGQCTNIAPLNPKAFPVAVWLQPSVSFVGMSGSGANAAALVGPWDNVTVDNNQITLLGGFLAFNDVKNLAFNAGMVGMLVGNNANYTRVQDNNFNTALGMWTAATDIRSIFDNNSFNGFAPWVSGGLWSHRIDFALGGGGFFDSPYVGNMLVRGQYYGGAGSVSQKLDDWFDQNFWLSSASGNSTMFAETCKFPAAISQRQTGPYMPSPGNEANVACNPGISSQGFLILTRDNRATGSPFMANFDAKNISRNVFCCEAGGLQAWNWGSEGAQPLTGTNDPYRAATTLEGGIKLTDTGNSSHVGTRANFNSFGYNGSSGPLWQLFSISQQGSPITVAWKNLGGGGAVNAQPAENYNFLSPETLPQGIAVGTAGVNSSNYGVDLYGPFGSSNLNKKTGRVISTSNGVNLQGSDGTNYFDSLYATSTNIQAKQQFLAQNGLYVCNPSSSSLCASLSFSGTTNRTVNIPDATSTTVQGAGSATSGNVVQYVDTNGVQHYTPASTYTASQIVALFTSCTGTMYLGADGACHNSSSYTLPAATTSTLGGVKCDGTTVTCAADGTISSSAGTAAAIIASSSGTSNGSANVSLINYTTPSGSGHMYRFCYYVDDIVQATAGTFVVNGVIYSNGSHTLQSSVTSNLSATSFNVGEGCQTVYSQPSASLFENLNFTGVTGSPTFTYVATLELLK